jgi:autotransporter-associated beta strand protein
MLRARFFPRPDRRSQGLARRGRPASRHQFRIGPRLEMFEDRVVPAVHVWSGAVSNSWVDGGNWSVGGTPFGDPSPTVVFPQVAARHTVNVDLFVPQPIAGMEFLGSGYLVQGRNPLVFTGNTIIVTRNDIGTNTIAMTIDQENFKPFLAPANHVYEVNDGGTLDIEGTVTGGSFLNTLDKLGIGTLKLSRLSNYGGATAIRAGTLLTAGNFILPSGTPVTMDNGATFDLGFNNERIGSLAGAGKVVLNGTLLTGGDNQSTTFDGTFTDIAFLVKEGAGTFTLDAFHAYTGLTLAIDAGTVRLGAADVLTAPVQVEAGATLDLQSHPQALAGLAGSGSVLLGSATLTVASSFTAGASSFGGVISGTGGLDKVGPAAMVVSGPETYTGLTLVQGGDFVLEGSLASGLAIVEPGATLEGTGTLKDLVTAGVLSPGITTPKSTRGTLHTGNVTFAPGSAFAVLLDSPTSFDRLAAAGTVNLSAAPALKVTLAYTPAVGDSFTILQSTKGLIGTFLGQPDHSLFKRIFNSSGSVFDVTGYPIIISLDSRYLNGIGFFD